LEDLDDPVRLVARRKAIEPRDREVQHGDRCRVERAKDSRDVMQDGRSLLGEMEPDELQVADGAVESTKDGLVLTAKHRGCEEQELLDRVDLKRTFLVIAQLSLGIGDHLAYRNGLRWHDVLSDEGGLLQDDLARSEEAKDYYNYSIFRYYSQ